MRWLESLWQDVRLSVRGLLRTPGITAAALLALALGIGATTALFSVASATLWRELPFRDPDRLVLVWQENPELDNSYWPSNSYILSQWKQRSTAFSGLSGIGFARRNMSSPGEPALVQTAIVTPDFLKVSGVKLSAGRGFREEEIRRKIPVVLISERLFRERFGGDESRLKQGVVLNGTRFSVVGVAAPGVGILNDWDLWIPRPLDSGKKTYSTRVLGRLAPGVSLEEAKRELDAILQDLTSGEPELFQGMSVRLQPLRTDRLLEVDRAIRVLGALVCLLLLIACADVAGLLLARATAHEREIALRAVLGAGRGRLVRRLLTESLLLSLAGGLLGILLAWWGTPAVLAFALRMLPESMKIGIDGRLLGFTLAVSLATGLLASLIPTLSVTGRRLSEALKEGPGLAGRPEKSLARDLLVTGQVALTLVLAVAAGLLLQSFNRLKDLDPGFDPRSVVATKIFLSSPQSSSPEQKAGLYQRLLDKVGKLPNVEAAAFVESLPFDEGDKMEIAISVEGRPDPPPDQIPSVKLHSVSPGYFDMLDIRRVRGRLFGAQDRMDAPHVAIVNETLADRYWPGGNPIGKRIVTDESLTVVGVVKNTRQEGFGAGSVLEVYQPQAQAPVHFAVLLVRPRAGVTDWIGSVRKAVRSVQPELATGPPLNLEDLIPIHLAPDRFKSLIAALFAFLAMLLAAIGIYGVISYSVARRTHEIGIRVALGAGEWNVLGQVIREGMRPVLAGVVLGLGITLPLSRLLEDQLYEIPARDFTTYLAATVGILCVGLVANYFPAQEATRVEPMAALRDD